MRTILRTLVCCLPLIVAAVEPGAELLRLTPEALPPSQPADWTLWGADWDQLRRGEVLRLTSDGGTAALVAPVPCPPALHRLRLDGAIVEAVASGGPQPWHTARVKLRFIDSRGDEIGSGHHWDSVGSDAVSAEVSVPTGAVRAELSLGLWKCRGSLAIRDLRVTASAVDAAAPRSVAPPERVTMPEAPWPVRAPEIDEAAIARTIHVAPDGSGDGASAESPLALAAGVAAALAALEAGEATRLKLAAGDYELESLELDAREWSDTARTTLLVIEGDATAPTRLLGSRRWSEGWRELGDGRFERDWSRNFGQFRAWNTEGPTEPIGWRREIVYAGDTVLRQVMEPGELAPGRFLVDEGEPDAPDGRLVVQLAADQRPEMLRIGLHPSQDVSWNPRKKAWSEPWPWRSLLSIAGKHGLVLRDLQVEHGVTNLMAPALKITHCHDVLLERVDACHNGGIGSAVTRSERVELRDCAFDDNGGSGASAHHVRDLRYVRCTSSRNNLRGDLAGYYRYAIAGIKLHYVAGLHLVEHVADANLCDGIWLDLMNHNVLLERCVARENLRFGIFHEVCWGGARFVECEASGNIAGIVVKGSYGGEIRDCHLHGNASQLTAIIERRTFVGDPNIAPLERWDPVATDWHIIGNRIEAGYHGPMAIHRNKQWPPWQAKYVTGEPQNAISFGMGSDLAKRFLETATFRDNEWILSDGAGLPGPTGWHAHSVEEFRTWQAELVAGTGAWPPSPEAADRDNAQVDDAD